MAEIGLAASVIQVAGAGLKLSQTLYQYADTVVTADRRLKDIAKEVKLTSFVIDELAQVFKQDESSALLSKNAVKTADETVQECSAMFAELEAALTKSKKNKLGRFMLPFRESRIDLLRSHIDKLKSTLQLLMQVLTHAHQIASRKLDREAEAAQRQQIKALIQNKNESTKRYEESLRNYSIGGESTLLDEDDDRDREIDDSESARDMTIFASSISSTITPKSLQTCVHYVQTLLEDIEILQRYLLQQGDGGDVSDRQQSLVGSYFRVRGHLDNVLLGSSKHSKDDSKLEGTGAKMESKIKSEIGVAVQTIIGPDSRVSKALVSQGIIREMSSRNKPSQSWTEADVQKAMLEAKEKAIREERERAAAEMRKKEGRTEELENMEKEVILLREKIAKREKHKNIAQVAKRKDRLYHFETSSEEEVALRYGPGPPRVLVEERISLEDKRPSRHSQRRAVSYSRGGSDWEDESQVSKEEQKFERILDVDIFQLPTDEWKAWGLLLSASTETFLAKYMERKGHSRSTTDSFRISISFYDIAQNQYETLILGPGHRPFLEYQKLQAQGCYPKFVFERFDMVSSPPTEPMNGGSRFQADEKQMVQARKRAALEKELDMVEAMLAKTALNTRAKEALESEQQTLQRALIDLQAKSMSQMLRDQSKLVDEQGQRIDRLQAKSSIVSSDIVGNTARLKRLPLDEPSSQRRKKPDRYVELTFTDSEEEFDERACCRRRPPPAHSARQRYLPEEDDDNMYSPYASGLHRRHPHSQYGHSPSGLHRPRPQSHHSHSPAPNVTIYNTTRLDNESSPTLSMRREDRRYRYEERRARKYDLEEELDDLHSLPLGPEALPEDYGERRRRHGREVSDGDSEPEKAGEGLEEEHAQEREKWTMLRAGGPQEYKPEVKISVYGSDEDDSEIPETGAGNAVADSEIDDLLSQWTTLTL